MPYVLARGASLDSLIARTPEQLGHDQGIDVKMRHRAISLNLEDKTLQVQDLVGEETLVEPYDQLIIATGAHAFVPLLPGREAEGVLNLRTLADGVALEEYLN